MVLTARYARASVWAVLMPLLLFGALLTFSRGAWLNLSVALALYTYLTIITAGTSRQGLKLGVFVVLGGVLALRVFCGTDNSSGR